MIRRRRHQTSARLAEGCNCFRDSGSGEGMLVVIAEAPVRLPNGE
jgi:hypothetical protein